jgi:hypothetical protein
MGRRRRVHYVYNHTQGERLIFTGTYQQLKRVCKKHKIKVRTREKVKGGWRFCVIVPKEVEFSDGTVLGKGPRVIRINPKEEDD